MSQEPNDRKHLTPRQIINRYLKGEYVDESIEAISSAISSCGKTFDSVTIPFPTTIVEKIYDNIGIAQTFYECRKAGKSMDDIAVPDYPQLRDILLDLSRPELWEAMQKNANNKEYIDFMVYNNLVNKYHLDAKGSKFRVISSPLYPQRQAAEQVGLSATMLDIVLGTMIR